MLRSGSNRIPTVYIASRFVNQALVKTVSVKLGLARHPWRCIQTWPNEVLGTTPESVCAMRDLDEIAQADIVLVLTEGCERVPGGMHFEAGYGYAHNKEVIVVGPRCHVFHHLPDILWYSSLDTFLAEFEWADCVYMDNKGGEA